MKEYIRQTFGTTIYSVGLACTAAMGASLLITVLITLLFMKMLIAKDRYSIAVMKASGFTDSDMIKQYVTRSFLLLFAGIVLGLLLANTLGQELAGALIALLGASSFQFEINPLFLLYSARLSWEARYWQQP